MKLGLGNILDHLGWDKAGQISQDFTQSTTDKWFKDQDKDTIEIVAAIAATYGLAAPGGAISGASSSLLSGLSKGFSVLQGGLGSIGEFFKSPLGKAASTLFGLSGGNGGILEALGITGKKKDMVEEMLTLVALSELGNVYAKDAINKAKEYDAYEKQNILDLVHDANKFDDPTYKQQIMQKNVEAVHNNYANSAASAERDLYSRGMGERTPGVKAGILSNEAQATAGAMRDTETANTNQAMQARLNLSNVLASATGRANSEAQAQRTAPYEAYKAIVGANKTTPMDEYYNAQTQQMKANNYGMGTGNIPDNTSGGIAGGDLSGIGSNVGETLSNMYEPYSAYSYTNPTLDGSMLNQGYPYAYKKKPLFPSM